MIILMEKGLKNYFRFHVLHFKYLSNQYLSGKNSLRGIYRTLLDI